MARIPTKKQVRDLFGSDSEDEAVGDEAAVLTEAELEQLALQDDVEGIAERIRLMPADEVYHYRDAAAEAASVTYLTRHKVIAEFTASEEAATRRLNAEVLRSRSATVPPAQDNPNLAQRCREVVADPRTLERIIRGGRFMPAGHVLVFTASHGRHLTHPGPPVRVKKGTYLRKESDHFNPGCTGVYISITSLGVCSLVDEDYRVACLDQMTTDVRMGKSPLRASYIALLREIMYGKELIRSTNECYANTKEAPIFEHILADRVDEPAVIASIFDEESDLPEKRFSKNDKKPGYVGLVDFDSAEPYPFFIDFLQMGLNTTSQIFETLVELGATHVIFADASCSDVGQNILDETGESIECTAEDLAAIQTHRGRRWMGGTRM